MLCALNLGARCWLGMAPPSPGCCQLSPAKGVNLFSLTHLKVRGQELLREGTTEDSMPSVPGDDTDLKAAGLAIVTWATLSSTGASSR